MLRHLIPVLLFLIVAAIVVSFAFQVPIIPPFEPFFPEPDPPPFPDPPPEEVTPALKNETVYVTLDSRGVLKEQRIVNRIYGGKDEEARYIIDYGEYERVQNLKGEEEPFIKEDYLLWEQELLKEKDIYYEGLLDKELPVGINITYYLDGKETAPDKLAGKSGELEIVIKVNNYLERDVEIIYPSYRSGTVRTRETLHVPLLIQGNLELDLNKFSRIESEKAMELVLGQSKQISFIAVPDVVEEIRITMLAENIEIGGIEFVVSSQIFSIPDDLELPLDLEGELEEVLFYIGEMGDGLLQIYEGADQILQAIKQFRDQARRIEKQIETIQGYLEDVEEFKDELLESLETLEKMLENLKEKADKVAEVMEKLPEPGELLKILEEVEAKYEKLRKGGADLKYKIDELLANSEKIAQKAAELVEKYEEGSELYELGLLLLEQKVKIDETVKSYELLEKEITALKIELPSLEEREKKMIKEGWGKTEETFAEVLELLEKWEDMAKKIKEIAPDPDDHENELKEIENELKEIKETLDELSRIPDELDRLVEAQKSLRDGIMELYNQGIQPMESEIIEQINNVRYGEALAEKLDHLADDYRSHADNERNRLSSVRFIMQTENIR